jgi:glycosyltransferase involved in cell wall biosynthesis
MEDPLLCAQFGQRARKRLDENFSWPVVAGKYVKLYKKVIEEYGP